jgi:tetratricopeptide (TPR) repeat protein
LWLLGAAFVHVFFSPSAQSQISQGRVPGGATFVAGGSRAGVFDAGDDNYDRFRIMDGEIRADSTYASRQYVYLPFPMLKMKASLLDSLMQRQPEYIIHPKDTRENKEARLLLTLFERGKYAVFLKTYDHFTGKYPGSNYAEILINLSAFVHLSIWRESGGTGEFDRAKALYGELVRSFPSSPLYERNYLILGFAQMEHGEALPTLQTFEGFLKGFPKSPVTPAVHRALAQTYLDLRNFDGAMGHYNAILRDFPNSEFAREARYRLGDVYFAERDWNQSIRAYETAIREFPAEETVYPNADFNMAEARFREHDDRGALENFVRFLNHFPAHEHGGYALTRAGELLEILGTDQRRAMGALLESDFRFPNHPGALVARIRILTQQMKGMKNKELKRALEEIDGIGRKLELPGISEFTALMTADGLATRGEYLRSIETLADFYRMNPNTANLDAFRSRIVRAIANEMKEDVSKDGFLKALAFYGRYSQTWLKNSDRIDVPFFLGQAYERAGAYGEARKIYLDVLAKRERLAGTEEEKVRKIQELLPSAASLRLRLASALASDGDFMNAYQQLKAVPAVAELTAPETVERVELSAVISEHRNENQQAREALSELARKWRGDPALLAGVNLKLAKISNKLGDHVQAETQADFVLRAEGRETPISERVIEEAYKEKAEAQLAQKKPAAAVETYEKLLNRFEAKTPLASVRYKTGEILFNRGDLKGAAEVWRRFEGTPNDLLWRLGKEKLDNIKWRSDYTKYLSRIPAMQNGEAP